MASATFANDLVPAGDVAQGLLQADIAKNDLTGEISDLETQGYPVIPLDKSAPVNQLESILSAILSIV